MQNSLAYRRQERQWTQQALGERVRVSRQTIISIESGRYDPSLPLAFRLAEAFDCGVDELFTPEPHTDPSAAG